MFSFLILCLIDYCFLQSILLKVSNYLLTNRTNCNSNIFTKNTPIRRRTFMLVVKDVYKTSTQEEKEKAVKQIIIRILKNRQQNGLG